jgi:TolB-like protein/Flp pilus assembly protein TadD
MGEVYLAHDPELGRDVAIKVVPPELADSEARLARLRREARALAALNHANVATVYGFQEHAGTRVIVMELVEGETLARRLQRGPVPMPEAFELAAQIARALEAAHEKGIVHRDLKPGNVMITPRGEVKVLDFGLAKPLREPRVSGTEVPTSSVEVTGAGGILGTVPYMSPEQARGLDVDERTDVWAFGCIVFEVLAGRRSFGRKTGADTLAAILEADPDWKSLPDATPEPARRLLQRALTKDVSRRLRHIGEARLELEELSVGSRSTPPTRGRLSRGVAVLAVLVLLVVVAWFRLGRPPGIHPRAPGATVAPVTSRTIAVLPFETLGQEEATSFTDGVHGDILTRLSKIPDLSVISRTSVLRFRNPTQSLPEIARELGVTWVLQGEVQEVGDQVQVNARLVHAPEDRQVWAESYRRGLTTENLFQIQSEVTEEIAGQLQARLVSDGTRGDAGVPTEDMEAYRLYVRGRGYLEQRTEDDMRRAVDYFRRAIERDPDYALAWAGLADALNLLGWYGLAAPSGSPAPEQAARRALELGPDLAEAHSALGAVLASSSRPDAPTALEEMARAIELRPSYAEAYTWLAWMQLLVGRPEGAIAPAERAAVLDPLAPAIRVFLAETHLANAAWEDALVEAQRTREIQPSYGLAHFIEGIALYHLGRNGEARAALTNALSLVPPEGRSPRRSQVWAVLGVVDVALGDREAASGLIGRLEASGDSFSAGLVHAALGDRDAAFLAFDRVEWPAYTFATEQLRYFYPELLGPLRRDARYPALVEEVDRSWGLVVEPENPGEP